MQNLWNTLVDELRDFCQQNHFSDICLGLSGGLDSAICAVLAADALGGSHVHAFMMKTKHTSDLSLQIARNIAKLNQLDYQELDIEPLILTETAFLQTGFKQKPKQIVLENLQARARGKILMAFSNQFGYLVLACGNKSEIAMGYCTLYGDTCGGLAPIAGLYKTEIFKLAAWRNTVSAALPKEVITRAPSAELADGQKDEDTLPPYSVLDAILRAYLDEKLDTASIYALGFAPQTVDWVIKRYHNQSFKRLQLPPALPL